jgi:hypothetical protein
MTSPGVAPPRALLVGRRLGPGRSESAFAPGPGRARHPGVPCVSPTLTRPSVATARGPPFSGATEGAIALAPSRARARMRSSGQAPGPFSPSCEFASSMSSRGAKPAMALLRFSTPSAWVRPVCRVAFAERGPSSALVASVFRCLRTRRARALRVRLRPGLRVSPSAASCVPLQSVLPVADRYRSPGPLPSWGCPRRVPPRLRGPFKALLPGRSAWRSWTERWVLSWGSPL